VRRAGTLIVMMASFISHMISSAAFASAEGDSGGGVFDRQGTVRAADGSLKVHVRVGHIEPRSRKGSGGGGPLTPTTKEESGQDSALGAEFCAGAVVADATNGAPAIEALCGLLPVGRAAGVPGRAQVLAAFRELGLYRGAVRSDPGRVSFVNLETYFWCGDGRETCATLGEGERTVTLLGQAVRIRPRIVGYEWRFGDGSGRRVTAGRVAHTYGRAGVMPVSVTLTWTADYAVGGGGFRAIGGTTTTTSPVRLLPVQEAETVASG